MNLVTWTKYSRRFSLPVSKDQVPDTESLNLLLVPTSPCVLYVSLITSVDTDSLSTHSFVFRTLINRGYTYKTLQTVLFLN